MDIINKLAAKKTDIEKIREKLTPSYLETATKTDLQKDIDEVDNLVKVHHQIYDETDWASKPPVEIIGYLNRKDLIGTERDQTLKILNDQIAKLDTKPETKRQPTAQEELTNIFKQLQAEKEKLTINYFSKNDATTVAAKKTELENLQKTYTEKFGVFDSSALNVEQKTKLEDEKNQISALGTEIAGIFKEPPKAPELKTPEISSDFSQAIQRIMNEFETLKGDITRFRKETVAKEFFSIQLQNLEKKILDRPTRETKIPTSRDDAEFEDAQSELPGTSETPEQKILNELKEILVRARDAKSKLTPENIAKTTIENLRKFQAGVASTKSAFENKVIELGKKTLSTRQISDLDEYKKEGATIVKFLNTTVSAAIEKIEHPGVVQDKPPIDYKSLVSIDEDDDDEQIVGNPLDSAFDFGGAIGKHGGKHGERRHHHKSSEPIKQTGVQPESSTTIIIDDDGEKKGHHHKSSDSAGVHSDSNATIQINDDLNIMPLKLETIRLPLFGGDLTEWTEFKDIFTTLVHENRNYSDTIKFHQLRSKLRGPALDTIRGYRLIGNNYAVAWEDLKKRYDRTENLVQEYIRKFLEVPAIMHRANVPRLRAIVDATNQMTRALPNLGADVHHWDPFICLIINSKLDEETRTEWKQHVGRRTNVTLGELVDFLETRAIDYQPSEGDRLSQMLRGPQNQRNPRRNIFMANRNQGGTPKKKKICIVCQGDHLPWACEKLKGECAKVRTEIIKSLGACFKCLLKHEIGQCNKRECPYCGGNHNQLLCYKKEKAEKDQQEASTSRQVRAQNPRERPIGRPNRPNRPNRPTNNPPTERDWNENGHPPNKE